MKNPKQIPGTGSTLLLSMWALVLLSAAILAWAKTIDQDLRISANDNGTLVARAMAHSGASVALHPLATMQTPLLQQSFGNQGYYAMILGEGGKLNLNWLLTGDDPRRITLLRRYLEDRGLTLDQTQALVDSMLDWVGAAGASRINAAEESADYHPPHRPFQSVDEVRQVRGSAPLVKLAGWRDDFTIYTAGPVDLIAAPLRILRLLPGMDDNRARFFLQLRQGPDGIDGTADDHIFTSMQEIIGALGLSQSQFAQMDGLVTINDPTVNVRSIGWEGKVKDELDVVARKGGGSVPVIYLWQEL